ncbi:DUF402 domain-containing protein [Pseudonocardiaceae bacterium YIM PH 21723]|nr:DUF402 domain-containing protein [Pseudonocardiaceae bacterium YIM PH 21723]
MRFAAGSTVYHREVLHGRIWLSMPVRVVADDEVLALWLTEGTPFDFPPHPFGRHPWSAAPRWRDTHVLQLMRPGDGYAVWGMFHGDRLDHWHLNFQAPYRRRLDGIDTLDHGVAIVLRAGRWSWKDRDDHLEQVEQGRLSPAEARRVEQEAVAVAADLDAGRYWWAGRWARWRPEIAALLGYSSQP